MFFADTENRRIRPLQLDLLPLLGESFGQPSNN